MNEIEKFDVGIDELQRTASLLCASGYFDSRGDAKTQIAQIATKILAGRELGYGPFASVNNIHVVQGKPTIGANLMAAAIKQHPNYNYRIKQLDDTGCVIEFFEAGQSVGCSGFSMDDAKAAGLTGKDVWKKFARNMLFARAISNGVRWYCPDIFNGNTVYAPDELDSVQGTYTVVDTPAEAPPAPNGSGVPTKSFIDLQTAIKKVFPKDSDDARHWLVERYTTTKTPDDVRTSSKDLESEECAAIAEAILKHPKKYQDEYAAYVKEAFETAGPDIGDGENMP